MTFGDYILSYWVGFPGEDGPRSSVTLFVVREDRRAHQMLKTNARICFWTLPEPIFTESLFGLCVHFPCSPLQALNTTEHSHHPRGHQPFRKAASPTMRLPTLFISLFLLLTASTLACRCLRNDKNHFNKGATKICCE